MLDPWYNSAALRCGVGLQRCSVEALGSWNNEQQLWSVVLKNNAAALERWRVAISPETLERDYSKTALRRWNVAAWACSVFFSSLI